MNKFFTLAVIVFSCLTMAQNPETEREIRELDLLADRFLNSQSTNTASNLFNSASPTFDDSVEIRQVSSLYPGLGIASYQTEALAGGGPVIGFWNFGNAGVDIATPNNMGLGTILFGGHDGSNTVHSGRIEVYTTEKFSPGNYGANMRFRVGGTSRCCGATRMTLVGATGNVGIGTVSPQTKLHIANGTLRTWNPLALEQKIS